jgi:hypothetical protein
MVKVEPLQVTERDLNVSRILTLMGADDLEVRVVVALQGHERISN